MYKEQGKDFIPAYEIF